MPPLPSPVYCEQNGLLFKARGTRKLLTALPVDTHPAPIPAAGALAMEGPPFSPLGRAGFLLGSPTWAEAPSTPLPRPLTWGQ